MNMTAKQLEKLQCIADRWEENIAQEIESVIVDDNHQESVSYTTETGVYIVILSDGSSHT